MVCFGFCLSVKAQQVCHWGFKNLRSRSSIVSWEKKSWVFMGEGLISRWGNLLKGQQANLNATNYQTSIFRHSTNSLSNISLTIGIFAISDSGLKCLKKGIYSMKNLRVLVTFSFFLQIEEIQNFISNNATIMVKLPKNWIFILDI